METWARVLILLSPGCWTELNKETKILSNTCYFCKKEYDAHNQEDRDTCLSKFENCIDITAIMKYAKEEKDT
jgi:hypothetical protein